MTFYSICGENARIYYDWVDEIDNVFVWAIERVSVCEYNVYRENKNMNDVV